MPRLMEAACNLQRVAMILNPVSGTRPPGARRSLLKQLAGRAGLHCEIQETSPATGAAPLAREAVAQGAERLLVCGGDGTITETAREVAGTSVALAVLPGGTANLLATNLGIPTDTEAAMSLALTGRARPIDVGLANGRRFLVMAGMGADARMVDDARREAKRRLGVAAYLVAGWRLLTERMVRYTITIDGTTLRRRAKTVVVANMGQLTGGVELVPGASPEDGLLDVAVVRALGPREILAVALRALLGRNRSDSLLEVHQGRHILIKSARPQPVHLDGDTLPSTSTLKVEVEPAALSVVRPRLDTHSRPSPPAPETVVLPSRSPAPRLTGMVTSAA